jgi:hypothetical protein
MSPRMDDHLVPQVAVWKYELRPARFEIEVAVDMPIGSRVLHVAAQRNDVCLWALVDPRIPRGLETRRFLVVPTGRGLTEDDLTYLGTAFVEDEIVLHVFEVTA